MIDVIKQLVEALEWSHGGEPVGTADAIKAGKKLIAELESQEPVAWWVTNPDGEIDWYDEPIRYKEQCPLEELIDGCGYAPLYTHPPQRTRVGLTDEEIWQLATDCTIGGDLHADKFARAIEAAHGIKE